MKIMRTPTVYSGGKSSLQLLAVRIRAWVLSLSLLIAAGCLVAPCAPAATMQDLNALENRFFEHTYQQETMEDRLVRLEKMVFGEARTGDNQDRLQQLVNAVPAQTAPSAGDAAGTASAGPSNGGQNSAAGGQNTADADDSDTTSGTDYPRVTELETVILGKSYGGEPIKHRLDQLELKVFGKSHAGEDLADRVDRIAQYADKKYHSPQAFAQGEPRNGSIEEKVAWLETQIEGQAFPQKPMIDRLRPLEQAMFPTDPTDIHASIPEQVNMLMSAVELLHKQQAGKAGADQELNIAPLVQNQQQRTAYARQNNYGSDLQREFQSDDAPAPAATPNYSPNYRPQQAYGSPSYTQSQGQQYSQPTYSQQAPQQASSNAHHGHPFFRGLAKALGEVGAMVGSSVMQGGMMNYGTGYGGYGMPGAYGMGTGGAVFGFP
ncbi:MAG: hypothetical protein IT343_10560 [Candidatus Melainabacteria bacterium]|jgi:hypothetical protein|nr:hypothetical protein [Candidatus Melainabacteria bacterium]